MNSSLKKIAKLILPKPILFHIKMTYNRIKYKKLLQETHKHYEELVQKIRTRSETEKIRFGMYVVFDSSFGGYELVEILKQHSDKFSLKIVIVPDSSRGEYHQKLAYEQTKNFFVNKYGKEYVLDGLVDGKYVDYSNEFDVIYCANPYDEMVPEVFRVQYLSKKDVLPIYIPYCFTTSSYDAYNVMPMIELSLFWKVIASTEEEYRKYKKYQIIKGKNVELFGYSKMDSLNKCVPQKRTRKRIIIAPHHTIGNDALQMSNFLKYSDFFLQLPELYPDFDFVFRPHPLLFTAMVNSNIWTWDDVDLYIKKLESLKIEYSKGGDYFDLFVNSDAMIHDCGSFFVEYLFVQKPCCYMDRKKKKRLYKTSRYGKKILKSYQLAYSEEDIKLFLEKIRKGESPKKSKKQNEFIKNKLMYNYPNASKNIFNYVCKEIGV